ncbi:hypothetical protein STEG23_006683 [Scotinomys teguina]
MSSAVGPRGPRPPTVPPPMQELPDLSHLTEEERNIIMAVMDRQKEEEEKEEAMLNHDLIVKYVRLQRLSLSTGLFVEHITEFLMVVPYPHSTTCHSHKQQYVVTISLVFLFTPLPPNKAQLCTDTECGRGS